MKQLYYFKTNCCRPVIITCFLIITSACTCLAQSININFFWVQSGDAKSLAFSQDGNILFTGGSTGEGYGLDGQVKIWQVKDSSLQTPVTNVLMGLVNDIAVSKNGTNFILGNGGIYCLPEGGCSTFKMGLFDYNINGALNKFLNNPGGIVYSVGYSNDEKVIAAGTGYNNTGNINIYDRNYNLLRVLDGHQYNTTSLKFTLKGRYLISGGYDGLIKFWDYSNGTLIRTLTHGDYLSGGNNLHLAISPDGKYMASTGSGYNLLVKVWRISDGKLVRTFPVNTGSTGGAATLAFTSDGKYVVAATSEYSSQRVRYIGRILFWDLQTGALAKTYLENDGQVNTGGIKSLSFSASNNYMAFGLNNNTFKVATIDYSSTEITALQTENLTSNKNTMAATAHPNPFAATTTMQFTLQKAGMVNIKLYNTQGKEVAVILNEKRNAGEQNILFSASQLPAGIYFYKIRSNGFNSTGKLVKY